MRRRTDAASARAESRCFQAAGSSSPEGGGLNALTGEFVDLLAGGVIDPVRVTRLTIENAASVAALLLTTEAVVAEELIAEGLARPSSPV